MAGNDCIQVARAERKAALCSEYSLFHDNMSRRCVGTSVFLILLHDNPVHRLRYTRDIVLTRRVYRCGGLAGAAGVAVSV